MALSWCCQYRTWVLALGFTIGTCEVTMAVVFYTYIEEVRHLIGYQVKHEGDLIAVLVFVAIDLIVNILMISGANKDYTGRRKDLRRWGFMVPWIVVYAINILGYFAGAIIMFYQLAGPWKALGILPLTIGCFLLVGHFSVLYFCVEQRSDYLSGACNNLVDGSGASSPS